MIRFLILSGYFELMMYLQVSGRLDQYINVHYRYLIFLTMFLSLILALVQLKIWTEGEKHGEKMHAGHDHGMTRPYQRGIAYLLLILPIIIGTLFPTISLDTTIVEAKGFSFPVSKESVGDPEMNTQYLKPDTSIYYNKSDYNDQMTKLMKKYETDQKLEVTDENYLEMMELIYNYPNTFVGKKISFNGFVYETNAHNQKYDFLFRFGIIHCVADSGVFGLMTNLPADTSVKNNQWLHIEGTITLDYFEPFRRQIPSVAVDHVQTINSPKNQYVYRAF
ncbi:TIGR03943 family protein [Enterococcus dongliensis]|uniref:TIGR03943 family protein n=1 Tax=Enterococcus dongliensis TaxID=2559925 RepID=A0AAW8TL73_9ENTE|nr:TIGR03943 family protein [Enterococcus dongliensis]MDT2597297.1 TIGR03943 family protein [Enterococcus dongliensis]MDT2604425.1 TIGR03943 family protein [Enterococcus dongliensis]MDT2635166.1 TIGR03943 family protein [Enterococcus dongliensis]MDT2637830.1 TIGR03943 family protein [Enterococcus dongliensis]MDT2643526.1 TIGR03943 family protein [Enterococcus dongliensis]